MPIPANPATLLPAFITFTGVDAGTPLESLLALATDYPVEFAFLLSPTRQGTGRFPPLEYVREALAVRQPQLHWAVHLCDAYSEQVLDNQAAAFEDTGCATGIARLQVNSKRHDVSTTALRSWIDTKGGIVPILNCRGTFPDDRNVLWLSDASEGTGTRPQHWPQAESDRRVGYAGGINAHNALEVVRELGGVATDYWIDMASGVRNAQGCFDIAICRQVCEAVYGVKA